MPNFKIRKIFIYFLASGVSSTCINTWRDHCFSDILRGGVEKAYWCREQQARRVVERLLIDSPPRKRAGRFFA
jgi:hypothetical protein